MTGKWRGNDGVTYYVRQIGDEVWWIGIDQVEGGGSVTNVFKGDRDNTKIIGEWQDLPRGNVYGGGPLSLDVDPSGKKMMKTSSDSFGATEWTKRYLCMSKSN